MNAPAGEPTSDDRLWTALSFAFAPITPILILFLADKKDRPFIKAHNMAALVWGVVIQVLTWALSAILIGACIGLVGFGIQLYWAYQAYQGKLVTIPVISDFVKNRGWA